MNIAILGYGTVGGGVHALLEDGRLGIHVKRVLDIRPLEGLGGLLTDNIADILGDPSIDCIVETIGGMHPALSYVTSALRGGKHVVTSNKELMSHAMAPLAEGAAMHNLQIRFSASVGGGIPWIENIARRKRTDRVLAIDGVVNGTTNFILDAMTHGERFDASLARAQQLGYAEADPTADLSGEDVRRKCAISASMAFDAVIEPEQIPTLGIASIRKLDVDAFATRQLVCKLMMRAARTEGGASAYVEPTLLPQSNLAAHVSTNHNLASMYCQDAGQLSFYGQGAGRYPTAQNILQDLLDIDARTMLRGRGIQPLMVDNSAAAHRYYIRTKEAELLAPIPCEPWGSGVLTEPVSVPALHALAATILARDPGAFFAGIVEDTE